MKRKSTPTSLDFFGHLKWLDGKPLLAGIEPYRREIFTQALDTYGEDGAPKYNLVLAGRGKKNAKSLDEVLAASEILPEVTNPGVAARLAFEKIHTEDLPALSAGLQGPDGLKALIAFCEKHPDTLG